MSLSNDWYSSEFVLLPKFINEITGEKYLSLAYISDDAIQFNKWLKEKEIKLKEN